MTQLIKQNQPTSGVLHLVAGVVYAFYTLLSSATKSSIHPQFQQVRARDIPSFTKLLNTLALYYKEAKLKSYMDLYTVQNIRCCLHSGKYTNFNVYIYFIYSSNEKKKQKPHTFYSLYLLLFFPRYFCYFSAEVLNKPVY